MAKCVPNTKIYRTFIRVKWLIHNLIVIYDCNLGFLWSKGSAGEGTSHYLPLFVHVLLCARAGGFRLGSPRVFPRLKANDSWFLSSTLYPRPKEAYIAPEVYLKNFKYAHEYLFFFFKSSLNFHKLVIDVLPSFRRIPAWLQTNNETEKAEHNTVLIISEQENTLNSCKRKLCPSIKYTL